VAPVKNTSVGQKWIAKRLEMGDSSNVSRAVLLVGRTEDPEIIKWKSRLMNNS
jgi:hypothetical protein